MNTMYKSNKCMYSLSDFTFKEKAQTQVLIYLEPFKRYKLMFCTY